MSKARALPIFSLLNKQITLEMKITEDYMLKILKGGDMEKFSLSLLCKYLAWVV